MKQENGISWVLRGFRILLAIFCIVADINYSNAPEVCILALAIIWDLYRLLHLLYHRSPGAYLEVQLLLEILYLVSGIVYISTRNSRERSLAIILSIFIILFSLVIAISPVIRYPNQRRQRKQHFTRKPKLAFTSSGDPVAVYLDGNFPDSYEMRNV